ncbi:hypothetical protein ABIB35_002879 [Arthrobacter sp. UYP6]|uniref:PLDc N-terminal domain-containing protein n=1 Tax=Arthrobacter sp. UYP6 TaxID=1756378 RepID=UPI003396C5A1
MLAWTAPEDANPVIPNQWEGTVLVIGVLALLLVVVVLIDIARSHQLTGVVRAVWVLVVLAFPVVGPLLWFLLGRRSNTSTHDAGGSPASRAK